MSKKSFPFLYSEYTMQSGQDFLGIQYNLIHTIKPIAPATKNIKIENLRTSAKKYILNYPLVAIK